MDEKWLNGEFGALLRDRRKKAGMSQDALAEAADLSRTSIVNIESGRQGVSLATLYRLADALACSTADLLPVPPEPHVPELIGDKSDGAKKALSLVWRRVEGGGE